MEGRRAWRLGVFCQPHTLPCLLVVLAIHAGGGAGGAGGPPSFRPPGPPPQLPHVGSMGVPGADGEWVVLGARILGGHAALPRRRSLRKLFERGRRRRADSRRLWSELRAPGEAEEKI